MIVKKKRTKKDEAVQAEVEQPKLDFSDKTVANCYEGLVCLDIKLSKLIDLFEPIAKYIEDKRNGTLSA